MSDVARPQIRLSRLVIVIMIATAGFFASSAATEPAPVSASPVTSGLAIYVFFTNHSDSALTLKQVYGKDPGESVEGEFLEGPPQKIAIGETATIVSIPEGTLEGTQFSVIYELENHSTARMTYENPFSGKGSFSKFLPPGYALSTVFEPGEVDEFRQNFTNGCECDGIPPEWKENGVTIDPTTRQPVPNGTPGGQFIDLPAMGVSLDRPNILVQMDWMANTEHKQKLEQAAIDTVIEAFNRDPVTYPGVNGAGSGATRPGITLIVDNGPTSTITPGGAQWGSLSRAKAIPWEEFFLTGTRKAGYHSENFSKLLNNNFRPTGRLPIFHYAVAAAAIANDKSCTSGYTPEGGFGFIVSLGGPRKAGEPCWENEIGSLGEQTGTFMHELGHVLGLHHGGEDGNAISMKPNYPSVMDYLYQFSGVLRNGKWTYDYSREPEPGLEEKTLTESAGISLGANSEKLGFSWICPNGFENSSSILVPVDWNCDGAIDGGEGFDVSGEQTEEEEKNGERKKQQELQGTVRSDWERINFLTGGVGTGAALSVPSLFENVDEITPEIAERVRIRPQITYTGALSGHYHEPVAVSATLVDPSTENSPVGGASLAFKLGSSPSDSCTASTDASGTASCTIAPTQPAGPYGIVVSFAGDSTYQPASDTRTFAITRAKTTLSYNGPSHVANGFPARLTGTLLENGSTPPSPAGQTVTFTLGSGSSAQSCSGTVAGSGNVQCTIASVHQPDGATFAVGVGAVFAGDTFYEPSSSPPASVQLLYYTARAYGSSFTLFNLPAVIAADTGAVTTAQEKIVLKSGTSLSIGLGQLTVPTASVNTGGGSVTATASGSNFSLSGPFVPTIQATKMTATSHTSCAGSTGSSTISSITINGSTMTVPNRPPNTVIPLPRGGSVTLNQQIPAAGGHGLTVNALHVSIPGVIDYVQSSATTGIDNCP